MWRVLSHDQVLQLLQIWDDKVTPQPPNFASAQVCIVLPWVSALLCKAMHAAGLAALLVYPPTVIPRLHPPVHNPCRCPPQEWTGA